MLVYQYTYLSVRTGIIAGIITNPLEKSCTAGHGPWAPHDPPPNPVGTGCFWLMTHGLVSFRSRVRVRLTRWPKNKTTYIYHKSVPYPLYKSKTMKYLYIINMYPYICKCWKRRFFVSYICIYINILYNYYSYRSPVILQAAHLKLVKVSIIVSLKSLCMESSSPKGQRNA